MYNSFMRTILDMKLWLETLWYLAPSVELKIFRPCDDAKNNITTDQMTSGNVPSAEQQAMKEEFKKKGWV